MNNPQTIEFQTMSLSPTMIGACDDIEYGEVSKRNLAGDVVGERRPLVTPLHRRDPNRVRHKRSSKDQCIFPLDAQLVA